MIQIRRFFSSKTPTIEYQKFIQFINQDYSQSLKKNIRDEIPLVGEKFKSFPLIEREGVIGEALNLIENHWNGDDLKDKQNNPLIGFHSVPGGGKSYLIDEFVRMDLKDRKCFTQLYAFTLITTHNIAQIMEKYGKKLIRPQVFADRFSQSIRIPVTFNKWATSKVFGDDPSKDIGSRLLYS